MDIEKSFSHITPTRNSDEAVVSKSTAQKLTSKEISDNLVVNLTGFFNTDTFYSNARPSTISLNQHNMITRHKLKKNPELEKQMALTTQFDLSTLE